jgi:hypothetical protein
VAAQPSERRNRRLEDEANRVELRVLASNTPSDSAAATSHLATPRGADNVLSSTLAPGSASTLGMFSPVSTGLESARDPGPSKATVDSDAARITEINRSIPSGCVKDAHQESMGSSSATLLRREELIPDSMRKTTLAHLETKTLKAFCNICAHHKNAEVKISDWVSYIPVELHTQARARIRSVVDLKTDEKRFSVAQVDNWQDMDVLKVLDVLIEPNAAALVYRNSMVAALENIELVPSEFFAYWVVAVRLDLAWVVAPVPCLLGCCRRRRLRFPRRRALAFMYGLSLRRSMIASSTMPHDSPDCLTCARFPYHSISSISNMHTRCTSPLVRILW